MKAGDLRGLDAKMKKVEEALAVRRVCEGCMGPEDVVAYRCLCLHLCEGGCGRETSQNVTTRAAMSRADGILRGTRGRKAR